MTRHFGKQHWWIFGVGIILAFGAVLHQVEFGTAEEISPSVKKRSGSAPALPTDRSRTKVVVVKPQKGGIARSTTQPGTMESFAFADLYAKVSGYVKQQDVDIGDVVECEQVLAIIDMPELEQELNRANATELQAEAQVAQSEARVATTKAEFDAATAVIAQADADLAKATSYLSFRDIQYDRIKHLFELNSVDERLVDEKHEQRDAAEAAENSARAAILTSKAQAAAAKARIAQAQADVADAEAKVQVAQANVAKAQVFVEYTKIVSPYNGVVTKRNFHVGDFIRAADQGGNLPLLTVARTDLMRVIVQVPEREIAFTDVGDPAVIELDGIAGAKFNGKVSRIAQSEDRVSRSMRTEIDLQNTSKQFRDGMWGRVTIILEEAAKGLTVPSSSLVANSKSKKDSVFVVRNGKLHLQHVDVGQDNGIRAEIVAGLSADDRVVARPGSDLTHGMAVETEEAVAAAAVPPGHG